MNVALSLPLHKSAFGELMQRCGTKQSLATIEVPCLAHKSSNLINRFFECDSWIEQAPPKRQDSLKQFVRSEKRHNQPVTSIRRYKDKYFLLQRIIKRASESLNPDGASVSHTRSGNQIKRAGAG